MVFLSFNTYTHHRGRTNRTRSIAHASSKTAAPTVENIVIRRASVDDIPELSRFSAKAAVSIEMQQFESVEGQALRSMLNLLEERLANSYQQELSGQLQQALELKQESALLAREYRLRRLNAKLEAELRLLQGLSAAFPRPQTAEERRQLAKWQRYRQFQCLVAEDRSAGSAQDLASDAAASSNAGNGSKGKYSSRASQGPLVGAVTLSLATPEAVLPPPLPSNSPLRVYVSNMSTHPAYRRRGIATSLLQACETVGRRWSYDAIFLHVDVSNTQAEELYAKCGYQPVAATSFWLGRPRQLLKKDIEPWKPTRTNKQSVLGVVDADAVEVEGSVQNGLFVWKATAKYLLPLPLRTE